MTHPVGTGRAARERSLESVRGPATGHRLISHHGSLFSHTGATEPADTVLLCDHGYDHELHDEGRRLTLKDGRILGPDDWIRP